MALGHVWQPKAAAEFWQTAGHVGVNVFRHKILSVGFIEPLKKRSDFLHLRTGLKIKSYGFLLAAGKPQINHITKANISRLGFTVTKKCGGAVVRNRIKRRLREASRIGLKSYLLAGHDYNIIGHKSSLHICFQDLIDYLQLAVKKYNNQINKIEFVGKI